MSTMYIPRNMDLETYESMYRDPETKAVENVTPWGDLRGFLHRRDLNLNQRSENSLLTNLTLRAQISPKLTASIKGIIIIMESPPWRNYMVQVLIMGLQVLEDFHEEVVLPGIIIFRNVANK